MAVAGTTRSLPARAVPRREHPLTESQLTEISSKTLMRPPAITSETVTRYGRKLVRDGADAYYVEGEPVGEETRLSVRCDFLRECSLPMLNAALALNAGVDVYRGHIKRLAAHKRLGDTVAQTGIKLVDYAEALSVFPEFVMATVCRHYWENDRRPFVPFIDEMKEACRNMQMRLEAQKAAMTAPEVTAPKTLPPPIARGDRPSENWTRADWEAEVAALVENVRLSTENPAFFNPAIWQARLDSARERLQGMAS